MIRIVQCWDDGVEDDIRLCELLREKGARASFNINAGMHGRERGHRWVYQESKEVLRLARQELPSVYEGFTIANHSLTHPWADRISTEEWRAEVNEGRKELQDLFGQPILGFAYPFGVTGPEISAVVREAGHVYARDCRAATPCFPPEDPMLFAADCHHAEHDFWERYARAKAANASVFYFWGHSYEFVTEEEWRIFADKLDRFNADPDAVWADLPDLFTTRGTLNT
jgi:peptidoglycan/xylan/chitin deacetylase (PgdA/CDA1 family)